MKKITFTLKLGAKGRAVADLQDALQLLIDRSSLLPDDEARRAISARLKLERAEQVYGKATTELVGAFQKERSLQSSGDVDKRTAAALNELLQNWGRLPSPVEIDVAFLDSRYTVLCRAEDARAKPIAGLGIEAFDQDPKSPHDPLGEPETTNADGIAVFRFKRSDFAEHPDEKGPDLYFKVYRGETLLAHVVVGIRNDDGVIRGFKQQREPIVVRVDKHYVVAGVIVQANGLPADKLKLSVQHTAFGGKMSVVGDPVTDSRGRFALAYNPGASAVNLDIRVKDPRDAKKTVALIKTRFAAASLEVLNLIAPDAPLASEYERMSADLRPHVGQLKDLSKARENAERRDLTVLSRATGWDARLIALAVLAERLSADAESQLSPQGVYGLLRAGLPSDKLLLAQVTSALVEAALTKVLDAGIIKLSNSKIAQFKVKFETFANNTRLATPAPGSLSTYDELLKASGLNAAVQTKFAAALLHHDGNPAHLWKRAKKEGLNDAQIGRLQLQGKLAFLAGNSAGMTARLMKKDINDPVQLVGLNLHRTESWIDEIFKQAKIPENQRTNLSPGDKPKLEALIPAAYPGEKVEQRLAAYAADMSRKIRVSYPTQVVAHLLEKNEIKLPSAHDATVNLLKIAVKKGYRLGESRLDEFLKANPDVRGDLSDEDFKAATRQMKTLQRIYQITPSNEAMPVLISLGMTSAYDVMSYSETDFTDLFRNKFRAIHGKVSRPAELQLVRRKAQQVISVTQNLFIIANNLGNGLSIPAISPLAQERERVRSELIKRFPTIESLLGSMDFCECEHCRTVLSPAAYLVDLLQFIDPEPDVWANFQTQWKARHGHDYPHTKNGAAMKPFDVLVERRRDLPHIQLTCQNTNTALPYIDLVNEILEYYVANSVIDENAARDTGDSTTAELLAEPQNVIRKAYELLDQARYPLKLPFDLWIETVRQFCNYFETPLARVLEVFQKGDDLFAEAEPFDRASVFMESLGLSPAEASIFTDPEPLKPGRWYELFGYPSAEIDSATSIGNATLRVANSATNLFSPGLECSYIRGTNGVLNNESRTILSIGAKDSGGQGKIIITFAGLWGFPPRAGDVVVMANVPSLLSSAKTLSRRLGVTYKEIVEIVQTSFVNPQLAELALLYKLGVTIEDARFYRDHYAFYEANRDLPGKERRELPLADQQRFDALSSKLPNTQRIGWEVVDEVAAFEQRLQDLATAFDVQLNDLQVYVQNLPFDQVLVLADLDAGCNFDATTLRYANGDPANDIAFLRINLFVRLWRKLGWSIEETDRALSAFIPQSTPFDGDPSHLTRQPLKSALIYLSHLKTLDEKVNLGKQGRFKLLTLWSDIATTGKDPLYRQLFLIRSVLKTDPVFDDPHGQYLSVAGIAMMAQSRKHQVQLENVAPGDQIDPAVFAAEPKIEVAYDGLQEVQHLSFEGLLSHDEMIALSLLSTSPALPILLEAVEVKGREFSLIKGHPLALQGALGLTAADISRILVDAGMSSDSAELSLANVSLLYRYGLLAKSLKLSVTDLIALKQMSGLDPFTQLHSEPLADTPIGVVPPKKAIDLDHPFSQTLRFVEVAEEVKASNLKIEDLEYLLRHRFDETGKYQSNSEVTLALLKTLAEGVHAIRAEHAVPDDSGALGEDALRQKLGLALSPEVVERFMSMMNGTAEFIATKARVEPANKLESSTSADNKLIHLSYDEVHEEQKLTFHGVLLSDQKSELWLKFFDQLTEPQRLIFNELLTGVQSQARAFFDNQLKKQRLQLDGEAGFLEEADFTALFLPLKPPQPMNILEPSDTPEERDDKLRENEKIAEENDESEQDNQKELQARRYRIAQAFLPFLQQRRIRQFIVQTMTAHTGADPVLVESFLTDKQLLGDPKALLETIAGTAKSGITASFFGSDDSTENALATVTLVDGNTGLKDEAGQPLRPPGVTRARLDGYLEVPAPGAYRFYTVLDRQGASAALQFDHLPTPTLTGSAGLDGDEVGHGLSEHVELQSGIPYRYHLDLRSLNGGEARLQSEGPGEARLLVQGEILPKDRVSQLRLYPLSAIADAERAVLLLTKALQFTQSLGLSEREIRYLLTHAKDFGDFSLSELPTQAAQDTLDERTAVTERFARFLRVATYARLKRDLAAGTDDLITIFEAQGAAGGVGQVYPLLAKLTRRDEATVLATSKATLATPGFANEKSLLKLWEALQVVERFGVRVASLLNWTRIVKATAAPEQRFEIARDLKETIKARFEPETWQRVAQPIFDKLRQRQRDALVSYVMHERGFDRLEQLYEYFLIDPGMEPVVQTSRIRLAIASVQLFIQRCLLNLEAEVNPSVIKSGQWEWMKRYRVWEANRKIFLFPENWLEPEFRDDKTHLFAELEGALLQGDVSSDLVEDAFLNYLKKLDELARLDIVAMHVEGNSDTALGTLHVFGRTYSQPHKYFYRRYADEAWTAWEPVSAEIEGDHLAPVIWRDRLYLFWLTFMDKPDHPALGASELLEEEKKRDPVTGRTGPPQLSEMTVSGLVGKLQSMTTKKIVEVQLHWSEHLKGEWSTRESGGFSTVLSARVSRDFTPASAFVHVSKAYDQAGEEAGVYIHVDGDIKGAFFLAGRNSEPEAVGYEVNIPQGIRPLNPYHSNGARATRYSGSGALTVEFKQEIVTNSGLSPHVETVDILQPNRGYTLLPCDNNIQLGLPDSRTLVADDPDAVIAAIDLGLSELASLMKPVFYQDNTHTFFVEPKVTEETFDGWAGWVPPSLPPPTADLKEELLRGLEIVKAIPHKGPIPNPDPGDPIKEFQPDRGAVITPSRGFDWVLNDYTAVVFDGVLIGRGGKPELEIVKASAVDVIAEGVATVSVHPGSGLPPGSAVVLTGGAQLEKTALKKAAGGLNVVGGPGYNTAMARNLEETNRNRFDVGTSNVRR